ncbi:MAG: hypothetical protein PHV23_04370 [Candidatus Gracilibacteria bacterium]|nr:hypothetical protein [Candidatus Gracilibacteria bacterium]
MKDFLKKYHNKKVIGNIGIAVTSLVLAFGINLFLIDSTSMGKSLKTSVLDTKVSEVKSDLFLEKNENKIIVKNSKDILNTKNISLSITYNPEDLEIVNINSKLGEVSLLGEKNSGFETILLSMEANDIKSNDNLVEIETSVKEAKSTQLNMINANFKDANGDQYDLSTSGLTF